MKQIIDKIETKDYCLDGAIKFSKQALQETFENEPFTCDFSRQLMRYHPIRTFFPRKDLNEYIVLQFDVTVRISDIVY